MAFVYKSENNYNTIYNFENELGPGEYIGRNQKPDLRQNQEPFNTSVQRNFIEENEIPGPGTYYKDYQKIKNLRNLLKSEHNQNIDSVRAQVKKHIICLRQTEKLGFDTKSKRFDYKNNNIEDKTPGPGHYFPSIINNEEKYKNKKIKHRENNGRLTFFKTKNNFSPDKTGFSTFVIDGGSNNNCRKTFQYDNFACRPKIFNFRKYREFMELNDSNSFASTNYSDYIKKEKLINSFYYTNNKLGEFSSKQSKILNQKNKIENKKLYKNNSEKKNALNYRINFCKKINKRKINNKNVLEKLIEDKAPGPGYYFDNIHDIGIYPLKPKSDYLQFFGSKVTKFHCLKKPWTELGPGQYFNSSKNIENKEEEIPIKDTPFGTKDERKNTFLCIDNTIMNPGPGEYEYQSFTNNAENDLKSEVNQQFLINGERFNDNYVMRDKYRAPGPGYYEPKIETIALHNEKINQNNANIFLNLYRPKYKRKYKKLKKLENNQFVNGINRSVEEFKYKEKIPPVGYYFPEFFNTIDYKNKKKVIDSKNEGVGFNRAIGNGLKKSSSTSELLGPGYYNININNNKKNIYFQVNPPFHSSCEKLSLLPKKEKYELKLDDYKKYYMKEFFNWNKRSFNVNFI